MLEQKRPFKLEVLIVSHNRCDCTMRAIQAVMGQSSAVDAGVSLFDDASTDGTPEIVKQSFPDVRVFHGSGNAFWNGGMHELWSAVRSDDVDGFLWLNDDTTLSDDAFDKLAYARSMLKGEIKEEKFILVGATKDSEGRVSYSGYNVQPSPFAFKLSRVYPDEGSLKRIQTFNGNFVYVSKSVVDDIGINDSTFFHNLGDVDYGLRAGQASIGTFLLPGTIGLCESNDEKRRRGYGSPELSFVQQWRKVNTHHGLPVESWLHFTRRHSGAWWPLHFILPYRHLLNITRLRSARRITP